MVAASTSRAIPRRSFFTLAQLAGAARAAAARVAASFSGVMAASNARMPAELEAAALGQRLDFDDLFEADAAPERVGFEAFLEREHHRFAHARQRRARAEGSSRNPCRVRAPARSADVPARSMLPPSTTSTSGALRGDAPADVVRERQFAHDRARRQVLRLDHVSASTSSPSARAANARTAAAMSVV